MTSLRLIAQSAMLGSATEPGDLLAAAIRAGIGELGGFIPATFGSDEKACPPETHPQMSEKAAEILKRILAGEFEDTLPEFLRLAAARGLVAPPETIPALLGLGKTSELRPLALAVSGERGRWLAAHNPAWSYALGRQPLDAWEHGSPPERLAALEQVRASDPALARHWLQYTWEQDSPETRAAFLATFFANLSMDDEPFLETCLDDKRKEVREAARALLLRLENSRFVQRSWARLRPLIRLKSKFLGGDTLEVTLPEAMDAAAKRDGLGGPPQRKKMGEKANLLAQMLSFVPPGLWSRELGRPPEKLIAAALNCEWKEPLLLGWQLATRASEDLPWAEAITSLWATDAGQKMLEIEPMVVIVPLVRAEKIEALVHSSIKPLIGELHDRNPLLAVLGHSKHPWSARMARAVIQSAQRQSGELRYSLPQSLSVFAHYIPPELADEFSTGWAAEPKGYWQGGINAFLQILNFRCDIRQSLSEKVRSE